MSFDSCLTDDDSSDTERTETLAPSVLVLGASGRTGREIIEKLSLHTSKPHIHAFVEDDILNGVDSDFIDGCTSIIRGSVRHAIDVEEALEETGADWVVLCGDEDDLRRDFRTFAAKNTAYALSKFPSVRLLAVSRIGASGKKNEQCWRRPWLSSQLRDYTGQENALANVREQTTLIRTTVLIDKPKKSGRFVALSAGEKFPSFRTDRSDLADCIAYEICTRTRPMRHRVVSVTSIDIQL